MGTPSWRGSAESWLLWIINRTKYYDFCRGHKTLAFISIKFLTFVVFEKMVILEIAEVIWPYLPAIYSLSKAIENAEIIQIIGDIFPTSTDYYRIWKRSGYVMKEKFSCSYHKGDPYIIWLVYILSLTRIVFTVISMLNRANVKTIAVAIHYYLLSHPPAADIALDR